MKKIIKYLSLLGIGILALASCDKKEEAKTNTWVRTTPTTTTIVPETTTIPVIPTTTTIDPATTTEVIIPTTTVGEKQYTRNGDKIYFGAYPQTKVEATLENGLSSITFDSTTWTSYNYYIDSAQQDFMYYKDIDTDNNGTFDYRGVYFTKYRPKYCSTSSSEANSYQDNNGFTTDKIHWFSYDPIEWDVLSESNGQSLIVSNLLLDSQDIYSSADAEGTSSFLHNGGTGYSNNYELSNARKFLNESFYNISFTSSQKSIIVETSVDNSASTTGSRTNKYACDITKDMLFLLSYSEASKSSYGLNTTAARQVSGTDYAKCQGLFVNDSNGYSFWWLRSPYYYNGSVTNYVNGNGDIEFYYVNEVDFGIRPTCWIKL